MLFPSSQTRKLIIASLLGGALGLSGCASMRSFLALDNAKAQASGPIHNPFGDFYSAHQNDPSQNLVLRTKKGDRSVEIELPRATQEMTDFTIPLSPAFRESSGRRDPASSSSYSSDPLLNESSPTQSPTMADREITRSFPQALAENEGERRDVEQALGLMPSEESQPEATGSYLAALDQLKALFKAGRYEAALLQTDSLIRSYPTSPKLYQMRGTLLDRVGQPELALKSWKQALRFEPGNAPLRKFIERREQGRRLASP